MRKFSILFLLLSGYQLLTAQVAQWNSTAGTGSTGVLAGTATLGAGLNATAVAACGNNVFTTNNIFDTGDPSPTTAADAVSDDEYIDFPITADAGYEVTITSIQFFGEKSNTGGNNTGLYNSSVDISSGGITWSGTSCANRTINNTDVIIPEGTTVNFRLYVWGATGTAGSWRVGSVQFLGTATLPIELSTFKCEKTKSEALLSFSTATEINNDYFAIERSNNGSDFTEIGQVKGAGSTRIPQQYNFTDNQPLPGKNYYRLRQVDFDGRSAYSAVVSVVFSKTGDLTLAPSPATDLVLIHLDQPAVEDGVWQVFDVAGRLVQSDNWLSETQETSINVGLLPEGMYTFRLAMGQTVIVKQFKKQ